MMKTLIIAECGSCHDGDFVKAQHLVDAARDVGADVAKFQFWSSADRLADRRRVPDVYREIYRRYQMPRSWLYLLKARCDAYGLEFMCTAYLPEDVAIVAPFVERFKIASFEASDRAFVLAHAKYDKPVIISCGMFDVEGMRALTDVCWEGWRDSEWSDIRQDRVTLMQCSSSYPAPVEGLNLETLRWCYLGIERMHTGLGMKGFSDHSDPALTWTGALAVAAGARIIEAHLKLGDTDPENPDAPHAMTPRQFEDYVRNIRFAEACLGTGEKRLQDCEREMAQFRVTS